MLEQTKRILFRIYYVLSKLEPEPDLHTGSDQKVPAPATLVVVVQLSLYTRLKAEAEPSQRSFDLRLSSQREANAQQAGLHVRGADGRARVQIGIEFRDNRPRPDSGLAETGLGAGGGSGNRSVGDLGRLCPNSRAWSLRIGSKHAGLCYRVEKILIKINYIL